MPRKFKLFSELRDWVDGVKIWLDKKMLKAIIKINMEEKKHLGPGESYISIQISNFRTGYFKACDIRPGLYTESPFEILVLKILDFLKSVSAEFTICYEFKKHCRLREHPYFKFIARIKENLFIHKFYWNGQNLCFIDHTEICSFKLEISELESYGRSARNGPELERENHMKIQIGDVRDTDDAELSLRDYYKMKENLLFWLDYLHIEIEVPYSTRPLLNLIRVILAGLSQRNEGPFRDFLVKGLYDPRLFLFIEPFLKPKRSFHNIIQIPTYKVIQPDATLISIMNFTIN